jgi:hypothetical protein
MTPRFHDECRILDVAAVYRCGFLTVGQRSWEWDQVGSQDRSTVEIVTEANAVRFEKQYVPFEWLPCKPTRGARPLWRCPTCGRLCWKLYSPPGGLFRCRGCWELEYRVRKEGRLMRRLRLVSQIGAPLAGAPAGGSVPPSYRDRHRYKRRTELRARLQDLLAIAALELMREHWDMEWDKAGS